ncbi:hypothetical protein Pla108_17780 [Botrimarina colliarenosi]|uniref:Uncharacterized protein n=1 Tax=Botrimarina colliarenosi TaxID=2528001 RepID=A0A5C6ADZ2_9BACT|nr:hypothetical protein [Botrimarina colliarenosi]TWT97626.1 hypothetical protein Pla108_17780 [Botrimarina colliarenosi]
MNRFHSVTTTVLAISLTAVTGCKMCKSNTCCPTDARRMVLSCAGEEAVRQGPCGPDASYYGYQSTCWESWPSNWEEHERQRCYECQTCETEAHLATPTPAANYEESVFGPTTSPLILPRKSEAPVEAPSIEMVMPAPQAAIKQPAKPKQLPPVETRICPLFESPTPSPAAMVAKTPEAGSQPSSSKAVAMSEYSLILEAFNPPAPAR